LAAITPSLASRVLSAGSKYLTLKPSPFAMTSAIQPSGTEVGSRTGFVLTTVRLIILAASDGDTATGVAPGLPLTRAEIWNTKTSVKSMPSTWSE
jgi:hypothetical protein